MNQLMSDENAIKELKRMKMRKDLSGAEINAIESGIKALNKMIDFNKFTGNYRKEEKKTSEYDSEINKDLGILGC